MFVWYIIELMYLLHTFSRRKSVSFADNNKNYDSWPVNKLLKLGKLACYCFGGARIIIRFIYTAWQKPFTCHPCRCFDMFIVQQSVLSFRSIRLIDIALQLLLNEWGWLMFSYTFTFKKLLLLSRDVNEWGC